MKQTIIQPPWKVKKFSHWATNVVGQGAGNDICEMSSTLSKVVQNDNAAAIVSAVNNTYGAGIRPDGVKELFDAAQDLLARVNRAREILQNPSSPSHGNWGMLDTEKLTAALEKAKLNQ